jgi:hypothetical protein
MTATKFNARLGVEWHSPEIKLRQSQISPTNRWCRDTERKQHGHCSWPKEASDQ